jgi:excisionase family DNA binding protein
MLMQEQVYSIEEAARLLRVNPMTIRRLIKKGEIRAQKVGKQYRIPRAEIDKFMDGGQQEKEDK